MLAARFDRHHQRTPQEAREVTATWTDASRGALTQLERNKLQVTLTKSPLDAPFSANDRLVLSDDGQLTVDTFRGAAVPTFVLADNSMLVTQQHVTQTMVENSNRLYRQFSTVETDLENLRWSHELLLNCCDTNLRQEINDQLLTVDEQCQGGPLTYFLICQQILLISDDSRDALIRQFIKLHMSDIPGEDIQVLHRIVSGYESYLNPLGLPPNADGNHIPVNFCRTLLALLKTCSVAEFAEWVRFLVNSSDTVVDDSKALMKRSVTKYVDLNTRGLWLPTSKQGSSFNTRLSDVRKSDPGKSTTRTIDRNPPATGEPHERFNSDVNKTEYWCSDCPNGGRWGNHLSGQGHIDFRAAMKTRRDAKKQAKKSDSTSTTAAPAVASSSTSSPATPSTTSTPSSLAVVQRLSTLH